MAVISIQQYSGEVLSITPCTSATYTVELTNNGASSRLWAVNFVAPKNPFGGTMKFKDFRWYCSAVSASPKVTAYIYSDSASGLPDASLQAGDEITVSGATAWQLQTWTTKYSLTEGTVYWIVLKCTSGTSATIRTTTGSSSSFPGIGWGAISGAADRVSPGRADSSEDNGATWGGTDRQLVSGHRFGLTDDTDDAYWGMPVNSYITAQNGAAYKVFGTIESGIYVTTPADATMRIKAVPFAVRKSGTPGALTLKIYAGDAVVATATSGAVLELNTAATQSAIWFIFSTVVQLSASTKYRFVLAAASGDSSNYYYTYYNPWDDDANSRILKPWSAGFCYLTGGAWTDRQDEPPALALILDSTDYFGTAGGGGAINLDKLGAL